MRTLLVLSGLLLASAVGRAAVPTLGSFEPSQFDTNLLSIKYRSDWTNEVGVIHPATVNTEVTVTNLNLYETFVLPAKVVLLTLGTNELNVATNSTWLLFSPTNDSSQVTLSLSSGKYQGQLLFITSQNGDGAFNLPDGSEQYDVPGALVDLQGNWVGTTNRGIILQYTAPDWIEMARFEPGSTNGAFGIAINPTDGVLPYRSGTNSFGDSALNHISSTAVGIGGTTNVLMRHVNGTDLVYTNGTTGSLVIQLRSGASATKFGEFGISSSGNTMVNAATAGQAIQFTQADSTGNLTIFANQFTPTANNTWDFGSSSTSGSWKNLYLAGYINWNSSTNSLRDAWGSGTPEGVLAAMPGSLYRDAANGNIYKKASGTGNTGWSDLSGGGGGSTIWTNVSGTIQPLSGQTTNRLSFTSGAADNATNVALNVGSASAWSAAGAAFATFKNAGTNVSGFLAPSGSLRIGAQSFVDTSSAIYAVHDASIGDPATLTLGFVAQPDSGFATYSELIGNMNTVGAAGSLIGDATDAMNRYGYLGLSWLPTSPGIDVQTEAGILMDLRPRIASTGSATAYLFGTHNVMTNGDALLVGRNAGAERWRFQHDGSISLSGTTNRLGDDGTRITYNASPLITFVYPVAASDETTAITAGTAKVTFRMPFAATLTNVRASLTTAQASGSIFTVDINEAGTTILSTKLTIDNTEKTSVTAATPPVISDSAISDDAEMTIDVDQIGTSGAAGLKVEIYGYQ